ncbi:3beta-hydroxysteroid-dehydrogenase/decarboxylase-like isoform X2 [Olea europaea var. sylvestris]|uniref:3beta-hydroxysteroid- dehydrogenase/decarboxylase-like isoform X2 n=1 Tax=Olea europaea var. sylvestris TaxID=158386 RepID=UPI000C1D4097|nr:3beta-hydroxysteroid-dehydrogenase/decarboxylase-like isoform X2 [Olea europaea var. sylvestris]
MTVADVLLWRNKKQTLTVLLILAAFLFIFIATGYTIITALSKLLLAASIFLFIHAKLPEKILGYKIEKIQESKFHISEDKSHQVAMSVASGWNSAMMVLSLLALSILGAASFCNMFIIGVSQCLPCFCRV